MLTSEQLKHVKDFYEGSPPDLQQASGTNERTLL